MDSVTYYTQVLSVMKISSFDAVHVSTYVSYLCVQVRGKIIILRVNVLTQAVSEQWD